MPSTGQHSLVREGRWFPKCRSLQLLLQFPSKHQRRCEVSLHAVCVSSTVPFFVHTIAALWTPVVVAVSEAVVDAARSMPSSPAPTSLARGPSTGRSSRRPSAHHAVRRGSALDRDRAAMIMPHEAGQRFEDLYALDKRLASGGKSCFDILCLVHSVAMPMKVALRTQTLTTSLLRLCSCRKRSRVECSAQRHWRPGRSEDHSAKGR